MTVHLTERKKNALTHLLLAVVQTLTIVAVLTHFITHP